MSRCRSLIGPARTAAVKHFFSAHSRVDAQRGLEVMVAADTPQAVLQWLERHNQQADAMFRVPNDESEATGAAPH